MFRLQNPYNIAVDGMSYTPLAFIPIMRPKVLKKKIIGGKTKYQVQDMDDWFVRAAIGTTVMVPLIGFFCMLRLIKMVYLLLQVTPEILKNGDVCNKQVFQNDLF